MAEEKIKFNFRPLEAGEIEIRQGAGKCLLLYKNARIDMQLLDEVVGPMNWKREHSRDNANCTVSIWDKEKKEWVSKEDTGVESNMAAEKGLASDSFKRACTNWGIGRELYTAPRIYIPDGFKEPYHVKEIGYDKKKNINKLILADRYDNVFYTYPKSYAPVGPSVSEVKEAIKACNSLSDVMQLKDKYPIISTNAELKNLANAKYTELKAIEEAKK